jgi:hypothetical protein
MPNLSVRYDFDAAGAYRGNQLSAPAMLGIEDSRGAEPLVKLLEILPARFGAFIKKDDFSSRPPRRKSGRQPGRAGTNHQDVAGPFHQSRRTERRAVAGRRHGGSDTHSVARLHHAGAQVRLTIHCDPAIETGSHAAKEAPRGAARGMPKSPVSGSHHGSRHRLARDRRNGGSIDRDSDRGGTTCVVEPRPCDRVLPRYFNRSAL